MTSNRTGLKNVTEKGNNFRVKLMMMAAAKITVPDSNLTSFELVSLLTGSSTYPHPPCPASQTSPTPPIIQNELFFWVVSYRDAKLKSHAGIKILEGLFNGQIFNILHIQIKFF